MWPRSKLRDGWPAHNPRSAFSGQPIWWRGLSGFGFPVEDHHDRRGAGFFNKSVHQEPLPVARDHVLSPSAAVKEWAHTRSKQGDGCAGFDGLTVHTVFDRNGHEPPVQANIEQFLAVRT